MQAYNYGDDTRAHATSQEHVSNASCTATQGCASNTAYAPASGYMAAPVPGHSGVPPAGLGPVAVPTGYYPIELVQFWRGEHQRGQHHPLHWALFVRTASVGSPGGGRPHARRPPTTMAMTRGNVYELAGTPDTYTAQFLAQVAFEPETLPDWRGTRVIGWVHPERLTVFEQVARQVPVWRQRPDWRCQHWVYEVVRALGASCPGVSIIDGLSFGVLQRQMSWLLDAWESGDI